MSLVQIVTRDGGCDWWKTGLLIDGKPVDVTSVDLHIAVDEWPRLVVIHEDGREVTYDGAEHDIELARG